MEKRTVLILLIFLTVFARGVAAAELEPEGTPLRKFQRGLLDIILSPIDISTQMAKDKSSEQFIPTWATGFGLGTCFAAGRILAGVYEVATFPIPFPARYEPVVLPEFAWEHFDSKKK